MIKRQINISKERDRSFWMKKATLILFLLLTGVSHSVAQLAVLRPLVMEKTETPVTDSKTFADIEIIFDSQLDNVKVVKNNDARQNPDKTNTETTIYAQALVSPKYVSKGVTLTHPDFLPLSIEFANLGFTDYVEAGATYRITVEVPDPEIVEANKAMGNLDYEKAQGLYERYLENGDGEFASLAKQRVELIRELAPRIQYLRETEKSKERPVKIRRMMAAKDIYDKTTAKKAYEIYRDLQQELLPNRIDTEEGVTKIKVDSVWFNPQDRRAQSDRSLPLVDGNPFYSWITVEAGLDDLSFDWPEQFRDAEKIDGVYRVYVAKTEGIPTLLITHPDCQPLEVCLSDYGIETIGGGNVYSVKLSTPPAAVMEADRAFGNLDLNAATTLYSDILLNESSYDEGVLQTVSESLVNIDKVKRYVDDWKRIKSELSQTQSASREQLAAKTDTLIRIASELQRYNVPGMERNRRRYEQRKEEYLNSVFLTFMASEINSHREISIENGKPKPTSQKSLYLLYKIPKDNTVYRQHVYAGAPGVFTTYLPREVSKWLMENPGKELEVKPQYETDNKGASVFKDFKVQAGGKDNFKISLGKGDKSLDTSIYIENIKE